MKKNRIMIISGFLILLFVIIAVTAQSNELKKRCQMLDGVSKMQSGYVKVEANMDIGECYVKIGSSSCDSEYFGGTWCEGDSVQKNIVSTYDKDIIQESTYSACNTNGQCVEKICEKGEKCIDGCSNDDQCTIMYYEDCSSGKCLFKQCQNDECMGKNAMKY